MQDVSHHNMIHLWVHSLLFSYFFPLSLKLLFSFKYLCTGSTGDSLEKQFSEYFVLLEENENIILGQGGLCKDEENIIQKCAWKHKITPLGANKKDPNVTTPVTMCFERQQDCEIVKD